MVIPLFSPILYWGNDKKAGFLVPLWNVMHLRKEGKDKRLPGKESGKD